MASILASRGRGYIAGRGLSKRSLDAIFPLVLLVRLIVLVAAYCPLVALIAGGW